MEDRANFGVRKETEMMSKVVLAVTVALILGSGGCSTSGCPTSTPGTTGTPSATSSGRPMPNNCPAPASTGSRIPANSFRSPSPPISDSQNVAVVNKEFLYIAIGDATIQVFRIDRSTGTLARTAGSSYAVPTTNGKAIAVVGDPLGRFLFVGSKNTGEVWVYQINATSGDLTLTVGSPFTAQSSFFAATSLTVDAAGRFLYVGQAIRALES